MKHVRLTVVRVVTLRESFGSLPMAHRNVGVVGAGEDVTTLTADDLGDILLMRPEGVHHHSNSQI